MAQTNPPETEQTRDFVRERYGAIAEQAGKEPTAAAGCCGGPAKSDGSACCAEDENAKAEGKAGCGCGTTEPSKAAAATGCCGSATGCGIPNVNYASQLGYSAEEQAAAPAGADLGLGCGNPLAIASIRPGEMVLDLGSGAGFDCFLAARQLAGTGQVIGVDMTPAMIGKARANASKGGYANPPQPGRTSVEFRLGEIEALPVADASVDLIISNCVINLSPEKPRVLREVWRVLKPGGRLAIADVVTTKPLPAELRAKLDAISACVAGATPIDELRAELNAAGFARVDIVPRDSSREYMQHWTAAAGAGEFVVSALITAYKP